MERTLRLVVNNASPSEPAARPRRLKFYLVPESDRRIRRTVSRFSDFLLSDSMEDPVKYLRGRRRFDTSDVTGSILCLSPGAADSLQLELKIIAELSHHPALRRAAIMKLAESESP
ncbi:MAG TPA: hypothetical protein VLD37_04330 [Candidatus Bilamarchaeum sp.]|nr:hypothetical protein [Candidatus Bilamarchaeum sp.]